MFLTIIGAVVVIFIIAALAMTIGVYVLGGILAMAIIVGLVTMIGSC